MALNPSSLARARLDVHRAVGTHLFDRQREINLIDITESDGSPAIRYHFERFLEQPQLEAVGRDPIPDVSPSGFPIIKVESKYRLHQPYGWGGWRKPSERMTRANPLQGGISIGAEYFGSGTLGCIVRDCANPTQKMVLGNWHVLVVYWGAPHSQRIRQPGWNDGGTDADIIATLARDSMAASLDAAVALLDTDRKLSNYQLGTGDPPLTGTMRPIVGMAVEKSGRTSGVTYGLITGVGGYARLTYGGMERLIRDVVTIEPRDMGDVSQGGDSGSIWVDSITNQAIGLHFAGSDAPTSALAMDMQEVLDALNVEIPPAL